MPMVAEPLGAYSVTVLTVIRPWASSQGMKRESLPDRRSSRPRASTTVHVPMTVNPLTTNIAARHRSVTTVRHRGIALMSPRRRALRAMVMFRTRKTEIRTPATAVQQPYRHTSARERSTSLPDGTGAGAGRARVMPPP